jgi:hypothetical protein
VASHPFGDGDAMHAQGVSDCNLGLALVNEGHGPSS